MRSDIPSGATPYHVGLERFVDLSKPADFIGKAALRETACKGVTWSLASIAFEGCVQDAEAATFGAQPVLHDGSLAGETTVVVYSPRLDKAIGYARIESAAAALGSRVIVDGRQGRAAATVVTRPFFDPGKAIPRG
jgi:aminomethyltransferase